MGNESRRLLQLGALVIPVIAAAAGGKWAVDATRLKTGLSESLPTSQELDSLRGYVVRTPPVAQRPATVPVPAIGAYAFGGTDPFSKVARWETPKYSTGQATGSARAVPAQWVVSTIMITENRRVAVINGAVVSPGSVLPGGTRVLSIEPDHVVLAEPTGARREISVQIGSN